MLAARGPEDVKLWLWVGSVGVEIVRAVGVSRSGVPVVDRGRQVVGRHAYCAVGYLARYWLVQFNRPFRQCKVWLASSGYVLAAGILQWRWSGVCSGERCSAWRNCCTASPMIEFGEGERFVPGTN